jgi:ribosome-associated heat shock protein Hsp15
MVEKTRIDKWLWAVRIFKSRTIATDACKSGKVFINDAAIKASHFINSETIVEVRKNGFRFKFRVLKIIEKRVSASLAALCYENMTSEEELNKFQSWFTGIPMPEVREKGAGRPTKKERREIDEEKLSLFDWDDD